MPLGFNADLLPPMASEYVAWVDVMGTQISMSVDKNYGQLYFQAPHCCPKGAGCGGTDLSGDGWILCGHS
jgi:hypothetical protein